MYLAPISSERGDDVAYIMAGTGEKLSFRELDESANRLAHHLSAEGFGEGDTLLIVMENSIQWPVVVAAGMRIGAYVTPVNWHLRPAELAAIISEASPTAIVASAALTSTVDSAGVPDGVIRIVTGRAEGWRSLDDACASRPSTPLANERLGARVLFSGGSTGRPKAYRQRLLGIAPADAPARHAGLATALGFGADTRLLSPAPSYHAAPFTFQLMILSMGGSVVCLDKWDPALALEAVVEHQVTHSQWVPTMLTRLLDLPDRGRFPLSSSHRVAVTSGAPCPPEVKDRIAEWWGPILHEYYGASEGYGHTYISPQEAMQRRGSVGRALTGSVAVLDEAGHPLPAGQIGGVHFEQAGIAYTNDDPASGARWKGMGDRGYLDDDGYLYLAGRASFMIISGGVNIYPEEIEATLLNHPDVTDAAVFGVPHQDLGEQVTAVVELQPGCPPDAAEAERLIAHCRDQLASFKAPKEVRFLDRMPRLPTGKLNKKSLRNDYLGE